MSKPRLFWRENLCEGYTLLGTTDIPGDLVRGYIHLEMRVWFAQVRWAWRIF
jgi:hypothetical protein